MGEYIVGGDYTCLKCHKRVLNGEDCKCNLIIKEFPTTPGRIRKRLKWGHTVDPNIIIKREKI